MSINAKLYIEDRVVNILRFSLDLSQETDHIGYPSSKPAGGIFKIVFETTKEDLFFLWMTSNVMKNVRIVFTPSSMNSKSRTIELFDVYCLQHIENFNGINSQPMSTFIEISPAVMIDSGVKIFEKHWKVTDFSNQAEPTVINQDEDEEPNFKGYHFENMQGEKIEQDEINEDDEVYLIVKSESAIGKIITINLNDATLDYEYKGTRLENDILNNIILTNDSTMIRLKAIKQKN